jgi:hypothetical protein
MYPLSIMANSKCPPSTGCDGATGGVPQDLIGTITLLDGQRFVVDVVKFECTRRRAYYYSFTLVSLFDQK